MRIYNYILAIAGVLFLFYIAGLNTSFSSSLINLVLDPSETYDSSLYREIYLILIAGGVIAATIGFFTKSSSVVYLIMPVILFLLTFVGDFILVYQQVSTMSTWVGYIVGAIMGLLTIGFILALIEYWYK